MVEQGSSRPADTPVAPTGVAPLAGRGRAEGSRRTQFQKGVSGNPAGRRPGSRNRAAAWRDVVWGFERRHEDVVYDPPSGAAVWWYRMAYAFPDEVEAFVDRWDKL